MGSSSRPHRDIPSDASICMCTSVVGFGMVALELSMVVVYRGCVIVQCFGDTIRV